VNKYLSQRLQKKNVWKRIFRERLTEPIHLNCVSVVAALFGSFRTKVDFDLVFRAHHAFSLLKVADWAKKYGIPRVTAVEFGVANGAGLLNMCEVGGRVTEATGVQFDFVGFDGGAGLPPPRDYRDHPEYYNLGDYPMLSPGSLMSCLPKNARLVLGDIHETVRRFVPSSPVAFVSIDVDYYHSAVDALRLLESSPEMYLPWVIIYLDDVDAEGHNQHSGEMLAVHEFTAHHSLRPITPYNTLRSRRLFQRALWIDHMYMVHVFDHPIRARALHQVGQSVLDNPYLAPGVLKSRAG
jgi:hypothetical protein